MYCKSLSEEKLSARWPGIPRNRAGKESDVFQSCDKVKTAVNGSCRLCGPEPPVVRGFAGPERSILTMKLPNGSEILIESLLRQNVKVLFGVPGGVLLPFYDALYK